MNYFLHIRLLSINKSYGPQKKFAQTTTGSAQLISMDCGHRGLETDYQKTAMKGFELVDRRYLCPDCC